MGIFVSPERGRYAWMNPLAYLIHAKDEDKHAYCPTDVYTFTDKSYIEYYREFHREWLMGRGKKSKKSSGEYLDWALDRVRNDEIDEDDLRERMFAGLAHMGMILDKERNDFEGALGQNRIISIDDSPIKICVVTTDAEMRIARETDNLVSQMA